MTMSRLRGQRSDDGYSMILVLGIGLVLTAVAILAAGRGVAAVKGSTTHAAFGQNLDVAEAGIDRISARLQATYGSYVYCPSPASVAGTTADPCSLPADVQLRGFATKDAERQWAATTLRTLAAQNPSPLVSTRGGQYLAIKPKGLNTVYSMSWVPSYTKATRQRLLKSEYVFSTLRFQSAILTEGTIFCCPSYGIKLGPGVDSSTVIPVHTNNDLLGKLPPPSSGTLSASASGSCGYPDFCSQNTPKQEVPAIDPQYFYKTQAWRYADNWYDLCPDGSVRKPNLNGTPCVPGTVILAASVSDSQRFRGWTRSGNSWSSSGGDYPGVYYVFRGNVVQDSPQAGNMTTWTAPMTIITEATANRSPTCSRPDGNQTYKAIQWLSGGFIPGIMVVSGSDWSQAASSNLGTGAVLAQGRVEQSTGSSAGLIGQIVAENICGDSNRLQGSSVSYNGGSDLPLNQVFRNTLELELN